MKARQKDTEERRNPCLCVTLQQYVWNEEGEKKKVL